MEDKIELPSEISELDESACKGFVIGVLACHREWHSKYHRFENEPWSMILLKNEKKVGRLFLINDKVECYMHNVDMMKSKTSQVD